MFLMFSYNFFIFGENMGFHKKSSRETNSFILITCYLITISYCRKLPVIIAFHTMLTMGAADDTFDLQHLQSVIIPLIIK